MEIKGLYKRDLRGWTAVMLGAVLLLSVTGTTGAGASSEDPYGFINGDLLMADGSINGDAEPQIRADADGNFYIASERGLGGGTDAWKSTDGGLTYRYLGQPNALSQTQDVGVAPAGGDTDVAIAPTKNADGYYNIYTASLSLANVTGVIRSTCPTMKLVQRILK